MSNCCNISSENPKCTSSSEIIGVVNAAYSARAREGVSAAYASNVAKAFGYTDEQLKSIPEAAHMGLSCGNPMVTASIKEKLLLTSAGGGIDVFLAADKAGPTGKIIGIDMSSDMISLARKNAVKKGLNPPHVAFVEALLTETLPIESNSVDCVLSNCVINLLPMEGKASLLKEVHRILKPGGRVVLDDIVAKKQLPDNILTDLAAYVGCISGAILEEEYKALMKAAGLLDVLFVDTKGNLSIYYQTGDQQSSNAGCCSTPIVPGTRSENPSYDINEWVGSYQIYAMKGMTTLTQTSTSGNVLLRWWDAFPKPISSPASISAEEVATLIRKGGTGRSDFVVIDVRKDDHAGGHVRGSHNAPWFAQTFHSNLPVFFQRFKDVPKVIFYCQSSSGRGPRCAAWYQDYLNDCALEQPEVNHNSVASVNVLEGGIKNWLATYGGEMDLIDFD